MIAECSLYNADEMRQWDDFVKAHPQGTPFHLHTWIRTIYESYGFAPSLFAVRNGDGAITAILPLFHIKSLVTGRRVVSLPFSDFCGPLCSRDEEERELLTHTLENFGRNTRYIEIRSPLTNENSFKCESFYKRHVLRLPDDPSALFERFDKKTIQYSIRKAQKTQVEIREDNSQQGIEKFYLLNKITRKKHGIPYQSKNFFDNIYRYMFPHSGAFLLFASSGSRTLAGGLFLRLNRTVFYKYNASDPQHLTDKRPNHLLTWNAIEKACKEGCNLFCFGRTSPCNSGLVRYKEMWGAKALDMPYYYFPKVKGMSCSGTIDSTLMKRLEDIWRRLPDSVADAVSQRVMKHLA